MSILESILTKKCPRCRKSDLFVQPFNWRKPLNMPESCIHCHQNYLPEPGFYYGAMFMSYIGTGFLYLGIVFCLIYFLKLSINQAFGILLIFVTLTYFETARLARSAWIHLIVKYNKNL